MKKSLRDKPKSYFEQFINKWVELVYSDSDPKTGGKTIGIVTHVSEGSDYPICSIDYDDYTCMITTGAMLPRVAWPECLRGIRELTDAEIILFKLEHEGEIIWPK